MKRFILPLFALVALAACEEGNINQIGPSIGVEDFIITEDSTYTVTGESVDGTHQYDNTAVSLLGSIEVPEYGNLTSSFITQFTPSLRLDTSYVQSIDSLVLNLRFARENGFVGDSLAPMQLVVYQLQEQLSFDDTYTDLDPTPFYVKDGNSKLLSTKSYTATDYMMYDSIKSEYYKQITVVLPTSLAHSIYNEYKTSPSTFETAESFAHFFPGIYVTNSFGNGAVVKIRETSLSMYYTKNKLLVEDELKDTVYQAIDKDFIAVNNLAANTSLITTTTPASVDTANGIVVKTPATYNAEINFPTGEIISRLTEASNNNSLILNAITFKIGAEEIANAYDITPPKYLLMVRKSQLNDFFEQDRLPDSKNYFHAIYMDGEYQFGDISGYIKNIIDPTSEASKYPMAENEEMVLIPVSIYTDSDTSTGDVISSVTPLMDLSMARLNPEESKIRLVYTTKE